VGPFDDPHRAADTVTDYLRFLGVAGHHLTVLLHARSTDRGFPSLGGDRVPTVAARLAALGGTRAGGNGWTRAADQLGTAHDLLATHLGPRGELRTPDALELSKLAIRHAAAQRVVDLTRQPLAAAPTLLSAAASAQSHGAAAPLPAPVISRLRRTTTHLNSLLAAAPLAATVDPALLHTLDDLIPARPRLADYAGPDSVGHALQALSVLRLLVHRQSQGLERVNPHSLHDLCQLAVTACSTTEQLLPLATTPLGRVHRAATVDRLRAAAAAWDQADRHLYPRLRGLTRVPRVYRDAVTLLTTDCPSSSALTRAVLACLPRLATDASHTLLAHAHDNGLVAHGRDPGQLTARWRPVAPCTLAALGERLDAASDASRLANAATARHLSTAITASNAVAGPRSSAAPDAPHVVSGSPLEATS
jgi:hypothetical protein